MRRTDLGGVGRSLGGGKMVREVQEHVGPGGCDAPCAVSFLQKHVCSDVSKKRGFISGWIFSKWMR